MHKSDDATLISALRLLADGIYSEDGVANACIREAADRLETLAWRSTCACGDPDCDIGDLDS